MDDGWRMADGGGISCLDIGKIENLDVKFKISFNINQVNGVYR
jgi:hypothetical protein